MRLRRAGFAGYGEKRGTKVDTSSTNPERKSKKKTFKIKSFDTIVTSEKEESRVLPDQKIQKASKKNP